LENNFRGPIPKSGYSPIMLNGRLIDFAYALSPIDVFFKKLKNDSLFYTAKRSDEKFV